MAIIAYIFNAVIQLYIFVIFVTVILSWLLAFNVINRHNQFVDAVWRTCLALTEPLLRPIRRVLPSMGGIDISPIILLIGVGALRYGLNYYVFGPAMRSGF
ncbi:MAG: YggT family protein [Alphaproteobacteria bacterium]|nr:YggT family protein [Alphaproteobacteria bacterium]